jgi:hypothetical protein
MSTPVASIRFEAVIAGIEAFAASSAAAKPPVESCETSPRLR